MQTTWNKRFKLKRHINSRRLSNFSHPYRRMYDLQKKMTLLDQRKMRVLNRSPFSSPLVRETKSGKESNPQSWCQTQAVHKPYRLSSASILFRDPMLNQLLSIIQQGPHLPWSRKPSENPSVSRNKPKPLLKRVRPTSFSSIARRKIRARKLDC